MNAKRYYASANTQPARQRQPTRCGTCLVYEFPKMPVSEVLRSRKTGSADTVVNFQARKR